MSVVILAILFMVQRFGTQNVSYVFAPLLSLWMLLIGGIGLYNIVHHDPTIIRAINPKYIIDYFKKNKKEAWISLGGCILSITGNFVLLLFFNVNLLIILHTKQTLYMMQELKHCSLMLVTSLLLLFG